jgi:ATP-dependent DNA ligase
MHAINSPGDRKETMSNSASREAAKAAVRRNEVLARLRARTCILDGEAVACGENGLALFELVRHWRNGESVPHCG